MPDLIPARVESPITAADLDAIRERVGAILARAARVPQSLDDETNAAAGDVVADLTKAAKDWEALRVQAKGPFLQAAKQVDTAFGGLADSISGAKKTVQARQTAFLAEKANAIRLEAEERARIEEQRRLDEAARLEAEGKPAEAAAALDAALDAPVVPTNVGVVARSESSVTSLRSTWSFEVVDFAALPDQYKLPDEKTLGALARSGRPSIPGVRWVETQTAVARAR